MFPVCKDSAQDRIVCDRIFQNDAELSLLQGEQFLVSGSDLCEASAQPGDVCRPWVEDLVDFYPSFDSTDERALSNSLDSEFSWNDVSHFKCAKQCLRKFRDLMSGKIIVGLAGLPLGDKSAVGCGQTAHGNV